MKYVGEWESRTNGFRERMIECIFGLLLDYGPLSIQGVDFQETLKGSHENCEEDKSTTTEESACSVI